MSLFLRDLLRVQRIHHLGRHKGLELSERGANLLRVKHHLHKQSLPSRLALFEVDLCRGISPLILRGDRSSGGRSRLLV